MVFVPPSTCSKCGGDLQLSPALIAEIADVPNPSAAQFLCSDCSTNTPQPSAPHTGTRVFKIKVILSEHTGIDPETGSPTYHDIGGFSVEGTGRTVREFMMAKSVEWDRRMELVLSFADEPTEP